MLIWRFVPRVAVGLLVVTTLGLSGCGSGGQPNGSSSGTPSANPQPAAAPTNPPGEYDISRIAQLANQFPSGYSVTPIPRTTLTQQQADNFGDMIKKFGFTIDPPRCEAMLNSLHLIAGTEMQGLAAKGPQEIMVVAMQVPQPLPLGGDYSCRHIAISAPSGVQGTADRLPGPAISGATVVGVKEHLNITASGDSKTIDQYMYVATLGDKTAATVSGQSDKGEFDSGPLETLLVKAVTALRGH
jgi:Domain of unknown function (DUF5642)